jgi:hypothetical protein
MKIFNKFNMSLVGKPSLYFKSPQNLQRPKKVRHNLYQYVVDAII